MTLAEFRTWIEFYKRFPFDDLHRFHRPAARITTALTGGDVQPHLDWIARGLLAPTMSDADMNTLRAFGFKGKGG